MDELKNLRAQVEQLQKALMASGEQIRTVSDVCTRLEAERNAFMSALRIQQEEFFKVITHKV